MTRLLAILLALATASPVAAQLEDAHGIHVEQITGLDDRQLDVVVRTDALQQPVHVRILLPTDYDASPRKRFPVLYLFHGTSGRASDWVVAGDAIATTAGLPLIVVMPDAGFDGDGGGWFADWWNGGAGGQPMWETFHIAQVIPWIDDNLRTVAARRGRAVAGLSQGGFGAMSYAARHPDAFTSAASFSGGVVIDRDPQAISVSTTIIQFTTTVLSGVDDPNAIFGPRETNAINWQAHDPGTLVTNLRDMHVELWTGNGQNGPLDPVPGAPGTDPVEVITYGATQLLHGYLGEVAIEHGYHDYGPGTHTWPYWARDLEEYMEPLLERFRRRAKDPKRVDHLSGDDAWSAWGWDVDLDRPVRAFSHLKDAHKRGFVLEGTGNAEVETPAFYRAGSRVRVTMRGPAGDSKQVMRIGRDRRLRLTVPLGDDGTPATTEVSVRRLSR
jgi:S-formylglutathione hydrolase FrmB